MRRAAPVLAAVLLLTGCSQVAALAPVGGDRMTEIRFAAIDVLLDSEIEVREAPACVQADDRGVRCTGTTVDGSTITAESPADDQTQLVVRVDDEVLYEGSIDAVIEKAIRP